jgi:Kyakuja-Dileera-Zisupton transposase
MQVFSPDSVLQLVPHAAIPLLLQYSTSGVVNERLSSLIPALGMIFINMSTECTDSPDLRKLSRTLAERAKLTFNDLVNNRDIIRNTNECPPYLSREWEETGSFYGRPLIRYRPFYEGRDNDKDVDASETGRCKKYYSTYAQRTLTGGIMAIWCPHLICLGFHKIPKAEGRNDVFSALYVYFEQAPEVVIYDFACQLGTYSMSREPEFFKDTCFAIDEMHAKGHSSCSQASFSSNYMQGRTSLQNVNTSAAECSNSGLNRIRKSVSYMGQRNAILLTYIYLCVWNRRREREFQKKTVKERDQLQRRFHCII